MSSIDATPVTAELLSMMPEDGIERDIVRGELREKPMTGRNPEHSEVTANIVHILRLWLGSRPRPRGKILAGEAGFRLKRKPETYVGIDVACVCAETAANRDPKLRLIEGAPVLAVEILSPSDRVEEISEKIELYLEVGAMVWIVNPNQRTVAVHKPGKPVEIYNESQTLDGAPELPGFSASVKDCFDD